MKVSVYIATSLDGFIARENGDLDWLTTADEPTDRVQDDRGEGDKTESPSNVEDYGYAAFYDSIDVLIMGRHTFEKVLTFDTWPYIDKKVVVLSTRLTQTPEYLPTNVEVLRNQPAALLHDLSAQGFRHAYIDGGSTIQAFLQAGLVDEMTITKVPVLIGSGIPLFGPLSKDVKWSHLETVQFQSGLVQSKYRII